MRRPRAAAGEPGAAIGQEPAARPGGEEKDPENQEGLSGPKWPEWTQVGGPLWALSPVGWGGGLMEGGRVGKWLALPVLQTVSTVWWHATVGLRVRSFVCGRMHVRAQATGNISGLGRDLHQCSMSGA